MNLPDIVKVEAHELHPEDLVVLTVGNILSAAQHENMLALLQRTFKQQRVLILDAGMTLEVYREKKEHRPYGSRPECSSPS